MFIFCMCLKLHIVSTSIKISQSPWMICFINNVSKVDERHVPAIQIGDVNNCWTTLFCVLHFENFLPDICYMSRYVLNPKTH